MTKEQAELAHNDALTALVARNLTVESIDKLTAKVTALEESLSHLWGENAELRGRQGFEAQQLEQLDKE